MQSFMRFVTDSVDNFRFIFKKMFFLRKKRPEDDLQGAGGMGGIRTHGAGRHN